MFNAILNKSIANHIREVYGDFAWSKIENKIDVKNHGYIYNQDEQLLLEILLDATSEVTNQSKEHLIEQFAEYFVLKSVYINYGALIASAGDSFIKCIHELKNIERKLTNFHPTLKEQNIQSIFKIKPRHFKITFFKMPELKKQFIKGLLHGLGRLYKQKIEIKLLGENEMHLKILA